MWANLKAMPLFAKIVLGCLLPLFIYVATRPEPKPSDQSAMSSGAGPGGGSFGQHAQAGRGSEEEQRARVLEQLEAQDQEYLQAFQSCQAEVTRKQNQTAAALMNGGTPMMGELPCEEQMRRLAAQVALVETEIYRLKSGDWRSTLREIQGIPGPGSSGGSASSYDRPSGASSDGTEPVDNWDRGAIRGTSLYRDENGEEKELPTAPYYYHDRETGQYVPSESPYPPNNGHNYERMTPEN
jgi:hypothetical protein